MMSSDKIMQGFPPAPENRVSLKNWRVAPYSRWAFQHVREVIPTAPIPNDPATAHAFNHRPVDLTGITFADGGRQNTVRQMLDSTDNDAFVVMHNGDIVFEEYGNGMTASTLHILFSVSKSVTAMVAGVIAGRGVLNPDALITDYIPEMAGSAFAGATVRHLLDMTAGITFDEDYTATDGPIIRYREASGWNVRTVTDPDFHMRDFLVGMKGLDKPHGGQFRYISPCTDLLGWVIERASGTRFADLMSDTIWRPMGAAREACIAIDGVGAPRTAGGICATARDLALFGQLILNGGQRQGAKIIPGDWVADTRANGSVEAWETGGFANDYPDWKMRYRNKWYITGDQNSALFAAGIHGQFLYVDPTNNTVCAKFSCQPDAVDNAKEKSFLRACAAVGAALHQG